MPRLPSCSERDSRRFDSAVLDGIRFLFSLSENFLFEVQFPDPWQFPVAYGSGPCSGLSITLPDTSQSLFRSFPALISCRISLRIESPDSARMAEPYCTRMHSANII